ncbi:MAG TPA: radical SAM protein [Alphaproteobacteria bacterium]
MQPHLDSPPKITISYTESCNLDCRICYSDCARQPKQPELSVFEWIAFCDYLAANGFIQAYIEGGEPLYRSDFLEFLAYAAKRMMTIVRTNGTLIDQGMSRRLKAAGVGRVLVDLMGATAATHEWFTRVPGSFARSCDAVRHLVRAGIRTDMLVILTRQNAAEIPDYLRLAHELGAHRVGILRLYPLGRAKSLWPEIALSLDEQMAVIRALEPPAGLDVMQSWHPYDHNCCWQSAAVTADGRSIGCMYLREYLDHGNIRHMPFLDTWFNNPLYRRLRQADVPRACGDCARSQRSNGGCRASAYAFHGRWDAPDPFCPEMNQGVDIRVLPERLLRESAGPEDSAGA